MSHFTFEEINLISIYHTGTRNAAIGEITAALPYMDSDMREISNRTVKKLNALTDSEYTGLSFDPDTEREG